MTFLHLLPLCRQPVSTRQLILAGLRSTARSLRSMDNSLPGMRFRTLDIIPHAFSLPRTIPILELTHIIEPLSSCDAWAQFLPGSSFVTNLFHKLIEFFHLAASQTPPTLPPLATWNPTSLATVNTRPSPKLITSSNSPKPKFVLFKKLDGLHCSFTMSFLKPLFAIFFIALLYALAPVESPLSSQKNSLTPPRLRWHQALFFLLL